MCCGDVVVQSACQLNVADSVLTQVADVSPTQQWIVQIGQCPQYTSEQVNNSSSRNTVWIYIAIVIVGALAAEAGVLFSVYLHEKDTTLRIAIAKHEESTRAHRWIIGYGE